MVFIETTHGIETGLDKIREHRIPLKENL